MNLKSESKSRRCEVKCELNRNISSRLQPLVESKSERKMEAGRSGSGGTAAWWYVCTLCNRATSDEAESRAHKLSEHKLVRSANILTLSEADLSPSVKVVTHCSNLLVKRTVKQEGDQQEPPDDLQTPTSTDGNSDDSAPEWKCKLCPARCPTQTHLKGHVLLHHAPAAAAAAGDEEEPRNVNHQVKQEPATNDFTPETPDTFFTILRPRAPNRAAEAALNLDEISDTDYTDFDSNPESASDWTDEEGEETQSNPRQRGAHPETNRMGRFSDIPIPVFRDNSDTKEKICGVCYRPQKNLAKLKDHVRTYHADHLRNQKSRAPCDCLICYQEAFLRPSTIFAGMFECKICNHFDTPRTSTIKRHFRGCHPEHQLPVQSWSATPSEWRSAKEDCLKTPAKVNPNSDGRYECTICNKTYSAKSWNDHKDTHTKSEASRTCPTCKQVLSCARYLKDHMKSVHQDNRDYLCSTCGKGFKTAAVLKGHLLLHDPANKIHKCDQCGKTSFTKYGLQVHKAKHAGRTHLCPECGNLFKSVITLRKHQNAVHLNLRTVKCDKCGERFNSHNARDGHMAKHVETKTLKCSLCPKMYKTKLQLKDHVHRVHQRTKKRFICKFCQKEFPGEASLGSHELEVHDFEHIPGNRYECKHCDRQFRWETNLKSHEKLHSEERSYACPEQGCGKTFKLGTHLYQHKFSHMAYEELPLVCEVEGCGKRFGVIGQLRSHKQRSHGVYDKPKRRANPRDETNPQEIE